MALSTIPTRALTEQGINFRNLIINGDMSIAQRGTSSDGSSAYLIDRFKKYTATTGNGAVSQSTDAPSGFEYSQAIVMSGSSSFIQTGQQIELKNIRHALGQQVTFSFYYKSSIDIIFRVRTRTDTEDASTIFSSPVAHTETFSSTGTWTRGTKTFTLASNIKAISVEFATGAVVSGDSFYLTGLQLEVGTSASDFEFLPYDVNLQRCQRYYHFDDGEYGNGGKSFATNDLDFPITQTVKFPTTMRANPTVTISGTNLIRDDSNATISANVNTATKDSWIYGVIKTGSGSEDYGVKFSDIKFDAEL
jgi:hypothetical protein